MGHAIAADLLNKLMSFKRVGWKGYGFRGVGRTLTLGDMGLTSRITQRLYYFPSSFESP